MKKTSLYLVSVAANLRSILLLSACGGGSDTSTTTSLSGNTITASGVTVSNSQDVGAQGYTAAPSLGVSVNSGAGLSTAVSTHTPIPASWISRAAATYSAIANEPGTGLVTGVSSSSTANCSSDGSVPVSYSVASTSTMTAGDTLTIATNNCLDSDTTLIYAALNMLRQIPIILVVLAACSITLPARAEWQFAIGASARRAGVTETSVTGTRLVQEEGWLPGIEASACHVWHDWNFTARGQTYRDDISYEGALQTGAPFSTTPGPTQNRIALEAAGVLNDSVRWLAGLE